MGMRMIEAAQAEWERWHGDMDKEDIPRMNPSFWKGFKGGAAWAGSQYTPAVEEPEEET